MTDDSRLLIDMTLAVPLDRVWTALRDPDDLARWFGWHYADLSNEIDVYFIKEAQELPQEPAPDGTPRRALALPGGDVFYLEVSGSGTRVRIVRPGPIGTGEWAGIYDDVDEGWTTFAHQLRYALERKPGQARRTVYLSGRAVSAAAASPIDALDLATGAPSAQLTLPHGQVTVAEWFTSTYQRGVVLDTPDEALLVVGRRPPKSTAPTGGGFVVLTTFGLDDATFERTRDAWRAWWEARYEKVTAQW